MKVNLVNSCNHTHVVLFPTKPLNLTKGIFFFSSLDPKWCIDIYFPQIFVTLGYCQMRFNDSAKLMQLILQSNYRVFWTIILKKDPVVWSWGIWQITLLKWNLIANDKMKISFIQTEFAPALQINVVIFAILMYKSKLFT